MINLKYDISYPVSTSKLISDMNERDHMAVNCLNDEEIEKVITNFVLRGITHNQINFWLIKKCEKENWLAILKKVGIDVNYLINSHELIILDYDEMFSEVPFSFNPISSHLENLKSLIRDKQKSGINAIGTLAGNLFLQARFSDCTNIERNWHEVIETFEIPITLLCLYNSSMSEKYQSILIGVHNVGILTMVDDSKMLKKIFENKESKNFVDEYYKRGSEITKKEFAILKILNKIMPVMREKETFEKNRILENENQPHNVPKWYYDLIDSLSKLYDEGYGNAFNENQELR